MSGRSCATAAWIRCRAWAILSDLFAPGFICITLTRIDPDLAVRTPPSVEMKRRRREADAHRNAVLERLAVLDPSNQRIARELIDLRARMKTLN